VSDGAWRWLLPPAVECPVCCVVAAAVVHTHSGPSLLPQVWPDVRRSDMSGQDMAQEIGALWRQLTDEQRAVYMNVRHIRMFDFAPLLECHGGRPSAEPRPCHYGRSTIARSRNTSRLLKSTIRRTSTRPGSGTGWLPPLCWVFGPSSYTSMGVLPLLFHFDGSAPTVFVSSARPLPACGFFASPSPMVAADREVPANEPGGSRGCSCCGDSSATSCPT